MHRFFTAILYFLSGFTPRNPRKVVFGAWLGKKFSDNPKYLLLYLVDKEAALDLVWIAESNVRSLIPSCLPVRFVTKGTFAACWERLTAGACFVTHGHSDLGTYNLMRGARRVYLGHGLAIKHMGSKDPILGNPILSSVRRWIRHCYSYTHYIASSRAHREKLLVENGTNNIVPSQILECGQPRIDFLLENSGLPRIAEFRARFLAEHGIPAAGKVITYLPTFRDKGMSVFSFGVLEAWQRERLDELLSVLDAVILEKSHFVDAQRNGAGAQAKPKRVFSLSSSASLDTQELLLATDLLITDYSGCYVDFLVLQRPILHFAYDRAYYENTDRGLYFNLDEVAGGPIVEDFEALCTQLEACLRDPSLSRTTQEKVKIKLTEFERGEASQQLAKILLELDHSVSITRKNS